MNPMPCRVSDDPYYDYSDYIEKEGVYKEIADDDFQYPSLSVSISDANICVSTTEEAYVKKQ